MSKYGFKSLDQLNDALTMCHEYEFVYKGKEYYFEGLWNGDKGNEKIVYAFGMIDERTYSVFNSFEEFVDGFKAVYGIGLQEFIDDDDADIVICSLCVDDIADHKEYLVGKEAESRPLKEILEERHNKRVLREGS